MPAGAYECGWLTADEVRAHEKAPIPPDVIDVTHLGSTEREYMDVITGEHLTECELRVREGAYTKRCQAVCLDGRQCVVEAMPNNRYCDLHSRVRPFPQLAGGLLPNPNGDDDVPQPTYGWQPWTPRHAWKLALATAAVWVAWLFAEGWRMGVM
jgi:hypothetical protein